MRSTSFEITVVAIVRVLLVMEKRVRSTSFSITSIWTSTMLLLVIDRVLARVQLPAPKIVVIRAIIDVMRLLLRCNNGSYADADDGQGASVSASFCRQHEQ